MTAVAPGLLVRGLWLSILLLFYLVHIVTGF